MSFATVLVSICTLILVTNGQAIINSTQQQVLLDIYNSCSPNCPTTISAGNCNFNSTSANQCSCNLHISCDFNGYITSLELYFTFNTIPRKHKPKTEQKKKKKEMELV